MIDALNKEIVEKTFNRSYNEDQFKHFIKDLLVDADYNKEQMIQPLPNEYKDFIRSAKRICKYKYVADEIYGEKVIDVLVVKLKRTTSVDRARTAQRNFVARYLNGSRNYQKDAALVAFLSEDENGKISPDWRFSLVQMNYKQEIIEDENGNKKRKITTELTPAKRFSFLVGENEDTHTAQKQFATCLEKSKNGEKITIEDLVAAFDIEKVSKEFFEKYKNLYLKVRNELQRLCNVDQLVRQDFEKHNVNIDDFAKKTLGQLVFLYFIQKKGWLGVARDKDWGSGDKKFLRNLFEGKYGNYDNFFNDILEHLFYEALASDRGPSAWFDKLNCRIPFLNGGLFEPVNGYEYQKTDLTIDNNLFKEIFDTFDLYNFTVKEDEPLEKEVAIDPEMLGKVFENLLPENIRKGNGAFYTPREIVHYMCQESLINYLYNKLNIKEVPLTNNEKEQQLKLLKTKKEKEQLKLTQEVIEEIISKEDIEHLIKKGSSRYSNKNVKEEMPAKVIKHAKILDNALDEIKVCDPAIGSGAFPVGMMNEIVRARAALSVYIGQPDRSIYELKRNAIENSIYGVDIDGGAVEIAKLRFWLSLVVDEEDIKNIKPLPNLDYKIMQGNSLITSYEGIDFDEIVDNQPKTKQLGLFVSESEKITDKISNKQQEFLRTPYATKKVEIKKEIEELIVELVKTKFEEKAQTEGKPKDFYEEKIRNFAQNTENRNFFPWKLFFADAFEKGGFDVVIGNPPYGENIKEQKEHFKKNYKCTEGKYEIYKYFIEKSLLIIKKRGILSNITPNTWLNLGYFKKLREIISNNNIFQITETLYDVFDSATVDTIVFFISKDKPSNLIKIYSTNLIDYKESECIFDENFIFFDNKKDDLILKIENDTIALNKISEIWQGLIAYSSKEQPREFSSKSKDTEFHRKLLYGKDIFQYGIDWGGEYLKYGEWLHRPRPSYIFDRAKLLVQRIRNPKLFKRLVVAFDEEKYINGTGMSNILINDDNYNIKYVLVLLNSLCINHWFRFHYTDVNIKPEQLRKIPIKKADKNKQNIFVCIVDKILNLTQSDDYKNNKQKQHAVEEYKNQIDIMVYKLYDLTYQEVLTIDKDFPMSESEYDNFKL